ncbi:hypothetical protein HNP48_006955 [Acidovorax soli]|uniref:Lipoprotein n=1 Tax=Acidovorax soli TaxID=592050 RepID=A0A7X0PLN9_9BURK|nr:hypothetical protein [Acidovorax soli]MBB6564228.1 hypothetical protein [Acidovorax soli]
MTPATPERASRPTSFLGRAAALAGVLCLAVAALATCTQDGDAPRPDKARTSVDTRLLATDIHVSIAQRPLVLPFVALPEHVGRGMSFSLDRQGDRRRAADARQQFLRDAADPGQPLPLDSLSVVVDAYGWDHSAPGQPPLCALLTREWARAVCDNPWAATRQALPYNRLRLLDLSRLRTTGPGRQAECREGTPPPRALPTEPGQAVLLCNAMVYGGRQDQHHHAVLRIDGDLGALWTVWHYGQNGETAEAMAQREGQAIAHFVQYALGPREDFAALQARMCRLRRPDSADHPHGADCSRAARRQVEQRDRAT